MPLSKKAETRILKLCGFMEALPKSANKHFNMGVFVHHYGYHDHKFPPKLGQKDLHTCGTTACALGWAATMPYFKRLGLSLSYEHDVQGEEEQVFDLDNSSVDGGMSLWGHLFGSHHDDRTPKQWAKRVRGLVKQWRAEARD